MTVACPVNNLSLIPLVIKIRSYQIVKTSTLKTNRTFYEKENRLTEDVSDDDQHSSTDSAQLKRDYLSKDGRCNVFET